MHQHRPVDHQLITLGLDFAHAKLVVVDPERVVANDDKVDGPLAAGLVGETDLDLEAYDKLITVVKKSSANNLDSAQLATRIRGLGEVAVAIAKKVPSLAAIL